MSVRIAEALASASNVYTWEPPDRVIAARYGLDADDILRFDLNTSPVAPAFLAEALAGPWDPPLNEYPDSTYADLADAAAAYVGSEPAEILVGSGADEVLDIIAKTFLTEGAVAVLPTPTYSYYAVLSGQRGALRRPVPRLGPAESFALDLAAMKEALVDASLVWLCAPNNPTGAPEPWGALEELLDAGSLLPEGGPAFVIDEAYHEFHPESVVDLRDRFPALVVVRTLSKAFALPGLRVGYAVAARPTIARLERFRPPGSISTVSAAIAATALRRPEIAKANAAAIGVEREWLAARLADIGLSACPSVTNFLLCRIGAPADAAAATEHLLRNGIVPRTFGVDHPLRGHLRFTVRDRRQDERLIDVLRTWMDGRSA